MLINCLKITRELIKKKIKAIIIYWSIDLTSCLTICRRIVFSPPTPSFLKTIQCLAATFNLDSNRPALMLAKMWCSMSEFARRSPLSICSMSEFACRSLLSIPRESKGGSANKHWGVRELIAKMRMRTCNCLIYTSALRRKRSKICIFYLGFVFSKNAFYVSNLKFH